MVNFNLIGLHVGTRSSSKVEMFEINEWLFGCLIHFILTSAINYKPTIISKYGVEMKNALWTAEVGITVKCSKAGNS